eukprot:GHVP01020801.1.p1 GENE.GHVP01020801.1~~GHVP01020801.1.p1  ORF type:complete len:402 (+),score=78.16 GHVP01020801.1:473-1678(+)
MYVGLKKDLEKTYGIPEQETIEQTFLKLSLEIHWKYTPVELYQEEVLLYYENGKFIRKYLFLEPNKFTRYETLRIVNTKFGVVDNSIGPRLMVHGKDQRPQEFSFDDLHVEEAENFLRSLPWEIPKRCRFRTISNDELRDFGVYCQARMENDHLYIETEKKDSEEKGSEEKNSRKNFLVKDSFVLCEKEDKKDPPILEFCPKFLENKLQVLYKSILSCWPGTTLYLQERDMDFGLFGKCHLIRDQDHIKIYHFDKGQIIVGEGKCFGKLKSDIGACALKIGPAGLEKVLKEEALPVSATPLSSNSQSLGEVKGLVKIPEKTPDKHAKTPDKHKRVKTSKKRSSSKTSNLATTAVLVSATAVLASVCAFGYWFSQGPKKTKRPSKPRKLLGRVFLTEKTFLV